jgi:NADH dehydrogenase FAD-containing subunit
VIVGGGFGGLAAAKALRKTPVQVVLIDRTNHHLFQPLLYQVATSVLAPLQISSPIRGILRKQKNTTVLMAEVTGVDKAQRCVFVNSADREHVSVPYDYLILATGVRHSYFGHNEFEKFAPIAPSPAGKWLGVETDRAGRVRVQHDLRVPGDPEIFVIGDTASLDQDGKPLSGVAQVAMQQGGGRADGGHA